MNQFRAFTVTELLVVIGIIAVLIGIAIPVLAKVRHNVRRTQNANQIRSIYHAHMLYSPCNNTYYPGVNHLGKPFDTNGDSYIDEADLDVGLRLSILLDDHFFTPEYIINPFETSATAVSYTNTGAGSDINYSYALLYLPLDADMPNHTTRYEWRDTFNNKAVVISDRAICTVAPRATFKDNIYKSVHTNPSAGITHWQGHVGFNDGHVTFETDATIDSTEYYLTRNTNDHLFNPLDGSNGDSAFDNAGMACVGNSPKPSSFFQDQP